MWTRHKLIYSTNSYFAINPCGSKWSNEADAWIVDLGTHVVTSPRDEGEHIRESRKRHCEIICEKASSLIFLFPAAGTHICSVYLYTYGTSIISHWNCIMLCRLSFDLVAALSAEYSPIHYTHRHCCVAQTFRTSSAEIRDKDVASIFARWIIIMLDQPLCKNCPSCSSCSECNYTTEGGSWKRAEAKKEKKKKAVNCCTCQFGACTTSPFNGKLSSFSG